MSDDGWITDKDAIFTLLILRGVKKGDWIVLQNMKSMGVGDPTQYDGRKCEVIESEAKPRYLGVARTDYPCKDANFAYFELDNVASIRPCHVPQKTTD